MLEVYPSGNFLDVELLSQKVNAFVVLLDIAKFLFRGDVPVCTPISNV